MRTTFRLLPYMRICILLLTGFCALSAHSQTTIHGMVTDSLTGLPLEFVNIGIPGKSVGTVSDENGTFTVSLPQGMESDTLRFSRIGYRRAMLLPPEYNGTVTIRMRRSAVQMKEVSVTPPKGKTEVLGNVTKSRRVQAYFTNNSLGSEFAVRLKIGHPATRLTRFFLNVTRCTALNPVFRINVYRLAPDGGPGENLLTREVLIAIPGKPGMIEVDLRPYDIVTDEDVFIAIEWIKDLGIENLMFSAKLFGSDTYYRQGSMGRWGKTAVAGVGLHAEVTY